MVNFFTANYLNQSNKIECFSKQNRKMKAAKTKANSAKTTAVRTQSTTANSPAKSKSKRHCHLASFPNRAREHRFALRNPSKLRQKLRQQQQKHAAANAKHSKISKCCAKERFLHCSLDATVKNSKYDDKSSDNAKTNGAT
jgi:hypothetical protein